MNDSTKKIIGMGCLCIFASLVVFQQLTASKSNQANRSAEFHLAEVVDGLAFPTSIAHANDDRLFITELGGTVRIVENGMIRPVPFLDISDKIHQSNEPFDGGILLGMAFHPEYDENGYVYVNYVTKEEDQFVSAVTRYTVQSNDRYSADPASEQPILQFNPVVANHNGGTMEFGPDGYLYIASGDGNVPNAEDADNNGQRTDTLLSKIIRIDVDKTGTIPPDCDVSGENQYSIPPENQFAQMDDENCGEIWSWGVRNPWGLTFDSETGDLFIADVGQEKYEEINYIEAAELTESFNFGWRCLEGTHPFDQSLCGDELQLKDPVYDYDHSQGDCSITGGIVYRGELNQPYNGAYFFSDYCSGRLWALENSASSPMVTELELSTELILPTAFGTDSDGELYVVSQMGQLYQLRLADELLYLPTVLK